MSYRIEARGVTEALSRIESEIVATIRQALGQSAAYAAELARRTTTFHDRTGALRDSIIRGERSRPMAVFVQAGNRKVRYAAVVEDGSKPHVIRARRADVLRFVSGGIVRFRKSVNHPGTKPTHFMRDARDRAETSLARFVEVGVGRAIQG